MPPISETIPWDHQEIKPRVLKYIEARREDEGGEDPPLLVETMIEDYLLEDPSLPSRIDPARLRHGISTALHEAGYRRRSARGRAWDLQS